MRDLIDRAILTYARFVSGALVLFGTLGLMRTHLSGFADPAGVALVTFTVNPLMSVIHLVAGAIGVSMGRTMAGCRRYLLGVAVVAIPFGALEFVLGDGDADIFARNDRLAVAHIALGAGAAAVTAWSAAYPAPAAELS